MKKIRKSLRAAIVFALAVIMILAVTGCEVAAGKKTETVTQQETASEKQTDTSKEQTKTKDKKSDTSKDKDMKDTDEEPEILEDEEYYSKDEVALYIHLYKHLPDNYISKNEAKKLGWVSSRGNLWDVAPGKCIGGDSFGNREGQLPEKKGRKYYECDVDYEGGYRGDDRLIYSSDGLVYYTGDHYNSFDLLYGEE